MTEDSELVKSFHWNERVAILAQHVIASLMLSLAILTFVRIGERLLPDWDGAYLVIATFIISLEAMVSYRYVVKERLGGVSKEWALYRLAEWVVILALLRLWIFITYGFQGAEIRALTRWDQFSALIFSQEFLFNALAMFIVWVLAGRFAQDFAGLEGDEVLLKQERESGLSIERAMIRSRLVSMIFTIGGVMVILTAILRGNWVFLWRDLPQLRAGVYNVLAYFVLGLVLLSLTQFSILRARWGLDQIQINQDIAARWIIYSFTFLFMLVSVSALLPTDYSLNILNAFGYIARILVFLSQAFVVFLLLLLYPILRLIAWIMGRPDPQSGRPELPQLPPPPTPGGSPPWLEVFKLILFGAVLLGAIGFGFLYYYRSHQDLLAALMRYKLIRWLRAFWSWLKVSITGIDQRVSGVVTAGISRLRKRIHPEGLPGWNLINLNRLNPRQRVLFFFLAMVRRGGERGVPRDVSQTPYEYADSLIDAIRNRSQESQVGAGQDKSLVEEEISVLTQRFVEARYSRHEITHKQADLVKRSWNRIKRALRHWSRGG
jgi:hypothetical protein